jgi:hypothetical protein
MNIFIQIALIIPLLTCLLSTNAQANTCEPVDLKAMLVLTNPLTINTENVVYCFENKGFTLMQISSTQSWDSAIYRAKSLPFQARYSIFTALTTEASTTIVLYGENDTINTVHLNYIGKEITHENH